MDRHVARAEPVQHAQRIRCGQLQADVAGNRGDCLQLDRRVAYRERNRQRVVDTGVDVEDDPQLTTDGSRAAARLKAGMTSVAKRSSCSRITRSSVPTTCPTWTS